MNQKTLLARHAAVARVFTPSTPIAEMGIFAGRRTERRHLNRAIFEPGRHALVYGPRGVGKTSLANVVAGDLRPEGGDDPLADAARFTKRVGCTREDTFDSIWRRLASEISIIPAGAGVTVVTDAPLDGERVELDVAESIINSDELLTASHIERVLRHATHAVLVFDEFDSLEDPESRVTFADLLKLMSDQGNGPTIVLVGVGTDIGELIANHESVERCLEQIPMPRMSDSEISDLVTRGFSALEMEIEEEAVDTIVMFSRGFPSFAHALAKQAAGLALDDVREEISAADVIGGAYEAVSALPYSLGEVAELATDSKHPSDTTESTLAAAIYVAPDRFRPAEVQARLEEWRIHSQLQTVTNHLKKLASPARGSVLIQHGDSHPTYEFRDPMMPPYLAIRFSEKYPPRD